MDILFSAGDHSPFYCEHHEDHEGRRRGQVLYQSHATDPGCDQFYHFADTLAEDHERSADLFIFNWNHPVDTGDRGHQELDQVQVSTDLKKDFEKFSMNIFHFIPPGIFTARLTVVVGHFDHVFCWSL